MVEAGITGEKGKERGSRGWLADRLAATVIMSAAAFELTRGAAARRKARERPSWDIKVVGETVGNGWWTIRTPDRQARGDRIRNASNRFEYNSILATSILFNESCNAWKRE